MPAEAVETPETAVNLEEALTTLNSYFGFVGVTAVPKINQVLNTIEVEGINLFYVEGGWGVSKTVHIPGCHTMPNGDPGYPEEWEDEIVLEPTYNVPSIVETKTLNRQLEDAVIVLIETVVKERLNRAPFYFL